RLFLLENEYMAAMLRAEIKWLRGVIADLESGKLDYPTEAELRALGAAIGGPSDDAIRELMARTPSPSPSKGAKARKPRRRTK
ncbi:MAG TPA: hypothetical protein VGM50_06700, partial [Gemmatimonadaceae bacterium]